MDDRIDTLEADARREGKKQAEAFEAALRREEDRERSERLTRLASGYEDLQTAQVWEPAPTEIARLRRQVESLAEFRSAVLGSKVWKLVQALRRLFGRDW
jgi:hypothetical protein